MDAPMAYQEWMSQAVFVQSIGGICIWCFLGGSCSEHVRKKVSLFPLTTLLVGRNCVHVYRFSNLIIGCHIWMGFLFIPVLKSMLAVSWVIQVNHYRECLLVRKESMPCRRVLKVRCRRALKEPCRRALKSPVEGPCKSKIWYVLFYVRDRCYWIACLNATWKHPTH